MAQFPSILLPLLLLSFKCNYIFAKIGLEPFCLLFFFVYLSLVEEPIFLYISR